MRKGVLPFFLGFCGFIYVEVGSPIRIKDNSMQPTLKVAVI